MSDPRVTPEETTIRALDDAKYLRSFHDEAKWWPIADRIDALVASGSA